MEGSELVIFIAMEYGGYRITTSNSNSIVLVKTHGKLSLLKDVDELEATLLRKGLQNLDGMGGT